MKHEPRQAICMEKALETAWVDPQVGWGRASGNHQGGANSVSHVDGVSYMAPARSAPLWEEGSEKEQWPLPALLFGRKLPPQLSP